MNKKNKTIIFILFIFIIICIAIAILFFTQNPNVNKFNEKINLIEKSFLQGNSFNGLDNHIVIISISDMQQQAIVKVGNGNSFTSSFSDAKNKTIDFIKNTNYNPEYVKIDIVDNIYPDFQNELRSSIKSADFGRKGIIFENSGKEFVLTEAEINSNAIIDYTNSTLNLDNLNLYLNLQNNEKIKYVPTSISSFSTKAYFCDNDNNVYILHNEGEKTGRRVLNNLDSNYLNNIVSSASDYLFNMIQDDGKFIYGIYPSTNREIPDYNVIRHCTSIWALITTYNNDTNGIKKQKINSSLDYIKNNYIAINGDSYYVKHYDTDELIVGANATALLAFCEYTNTFEDTQYVELAEKLGNGILSVQQSDGHFIHILNGDFSIKKEYDSFLYDGEATLALIQLYGITKNQKYLDAAEKSIQYYIANDYSANADHWLAYSICEISEYVDNADYYKLGFESFVRNIDSIKNYSSPNQPGLEMLVQTYRLYNILANKHSDIINDFPIDALEEILQDKLDLRT